MPAAKSAIQPDFCPTLFKSAKAFETWLKKNHATSDGLWLKIATRGANEPSVTYPEAVEIALCWGWIDGQKKGLDDQHCGRVQSNDQPAAARLGSWRLHRSLARANRPAQEAAEPAPASDCSRRAIQGIECR
jgi:uncharacterized protein YdeI (YjbR/CyaY-like superfamily)